MGISGVRVSSVTLIIFWIPLTAGFKVNLTGFDILSTGLPLISIEAKSAEPKLVGHSDT